MGLKAMKVLYKMIIALFLITLSTAVSAESVWDGSVSIARYGYLPQKGMYAASNAFPKNTTITVTNPETGKSVDVTVLERLDDNNLFLVLSAEAAEEMGVGYGTVFHGSITEQVPEGTNTETELPYNPDPDVNPSGIGMENPELALIQSYIDNELGGTDPSLIIPDTASEPDIPETAADELITGETEILKDAAVVNEGESVEPELPLPVEEAPELAVPADADITEREVPDTENISAQPPEEEQIDVPVPDTELVEAEEPEAEIIDTQVPDTEPVEAEIAETVVPEVPVVENMPLEEVYNKEPEEILPPPDLTELLLEKEAAAAASAEEEIPVTETMGALNPPVKVSENFEMGTNIPSLPVREVDLPVITTMPDAEETGIEVTDIAVSILPELPLIGVEEIIPEEVPVAVSMSGDVVLMEETAEITTILPELVLSEDSPDTPLFEEFTGVEPDGDSVAMDVTGSVNPLLPEVTEPEGPPADEGTPVFEGLAVKEPEPEEVLTVDTVIPEINSPEEAAEPVSPLPEIEIPKEGVEIVLEPSDYRPPVTEEKEEEEIVPGESEPAAAEVVVVPEADITPVTENNETAGRGEFNITRELVKDSYYLQLGAYREEFSALDLAGQLEGIYPVTVYVSETRDVVSYKVMVGPLGLDESGVILYNFKSMGYQDAFLRKGL